MALPFRAPAPWIWRPGEGWTYETPGEDVTWRKQRAREQMDVAQAAFDKKNYSLALRAARRVVNTWPLSDYAPQARYLVGRCYEAQGREEKAFDEYQKLLENQPRIDNYNEILQRQCAITDLYLAGRWFRVLGYIPLYPSMGRTAEMYEKIVRNGPQSDVAPQAQLKVGAAREKEHEYPLAVKAYDLAATRYHNQPQVAAEGLFREGLAYQKQAQTAEYDQSAAASAIDTLKDFITLYPNEARVPQAQKIIGELKTEQARGSFQTAKFYERYQKWKAALIYYNEVLLLDPNSSWAAQARERIDALKKQLQTASK